jgi:signal transduction histidine kinase
MIDTDLTGVPEASTGPSAALGCLAGGGEMGVLMRALDWSKSPLGPVEGWPQSLRTIVSTCLNSRFPILVWWGPKLVKLYNDAYRDILGAKHPSALGRPGREVWPEIWNLIGPMLNSVTSRGEATWSENIMLPLHRNGFAEECYFTFSYSPIRDEGGGIGGIFTAVTETTGQVLSERRLRTLRDLGERVSGNVDRQRLCAATQEVLRANRADLPFSILHLSQNNFATTTVTGCKPLLTGAEGSRLGALEGIVDVHQIEAALGVDLDVEGDARPKRAFVLPITFGEQSRCGTLVIGLSPGLVFDERYRDFLGLLPKQIGAVLDTINALEQSKKRSEALAQIDRAKTDFFSNVSHEFRTPLTLMLGPLEDSSLAGTPLSGEAQKAVHRNSQRLLKLVNTLLDFSRIEAGRMQSVYTPTNLSALTTDLVSAFRSAVERAGLRFEVSCPTLSSLAFVDHDMWEKIVLNLLSNALKFTFEGPQGKAQPRDIKPRWPWYLNSLSQAIPRRPSR